MSLLHKQLENLLKFYQAGKYKEAEELALSISSQFPKNPFPWKILGALYLQSSRINEAYDCIKKSLDFFPQDADTHNNLGIALENLGKLNDSVSSYKQAIKLKQNYPEAYNNLGVVLKNLDKLDESEKNLRQAINLRSNYPEAHDNLGVTLKDLGRLDEAEESHKQAIYLKPDYPEAYFNLYFVTNLNGNLQKGFEYYEYRFKKKNYHTKPPRVKFSWDMKKSLFGKKFLVYEEQGFGDIIQFYRFLSLLENKGAEVTFKVRKSLHHLLRTSYDNVSFTSIFPEDKKIDFEASIMSMPYLLKTTVDTIPVQQSYLKADPDKINEWKKKLDSDKFKVGICWQGSKGKIDKGRSFSLSYFENISKIPNIELISLYKGEDENKILDIDFKVQNLGKDFDNGEDAFIDTAAVMMCCDLIITSDTSIAHLAGALGRPVWVALKYIPDWRFMLNRTDSPWYPTMRLYRQKSFNNWQSIFSKIKQDLELLVKN